MGKNIKKICWVTPDYFVDCDFNPDILSQILKNFDIHWIILLPSHNARFSEKYFDTLKEFEGLTIEFIYSFVRQRDPRRLIYYSRLLRRIKELDSDIIYLNLVPDPYSVPFFWALKKNKTIFCAHDAGVHKGFDFQFMTQFVFKVTYKYIKFVCMFSISQADLFRSNFGRVKVFIIPLALKSFGKSDLLKPDDKIVFLSFGVINFSKNIELLIDAACNIYEKGYRNFKVSINGRCANWSFYKSHIRYPELFDCNIGIIGNREIPDLFCSAHYFVQPYRHVSQSGAMKVAFYYNLPVIASNFPGFSDEIKEGVNGYLFEPMKVLELEKKLIWVLENHQNEYPLLLNRMADHTRKACSSLVLAEKYVHMFNEVINRK
jgi:glycosyltransferase involved in cell wall biosynthesis